MKCSDFARAAGRTWEEKAEEACTNCKRCNGNFPLNPDDVSGEDIDTERIVLLVASIVEERKSGFFFEFEAELFELVLLWETLERGMREQREKELIALLKFQNEILRAGLRVKTT